MVFKNFFRNNYGRDNIFQLLSESVPIARCEIKGNGEYNSISGKVDFYDINGKIFVVSSVENLPNTEKNIFAEHIHEMGECRDDFMSAGGHFNPTSKPHPQHAGDLPPLFSMDGKAFGVVYTKRFKINEILGKSVIIHDGSDDFNSQPAGNSGKRIACGVILLNKKTPY